MPVPIQEKSVDIEKPAEELPPVHQEPTKESEQPMSAPVQRTEATSAAQTEFTQWADFMEAIYKSDIALYGVLNGARGYIRDEFFLIDSQNPVLRQFIKIPTHSKAIKQALFEVTGQQFKLGLFKKKEDDLPKRDPLEDLISMAQGHIDMKIE